MPHTPGPWTYGQCKKMGSVGDKARLVDRPGWFISAEGRKLDLAEVHCTASQNKGEQEANARLMAAAPDLLAACRLEDEINDYIESCDLADDTTHPLWPVVEALRAALAKAEGRS